MYFWKHFKMKMSENDHTNSLDPKRLAGPEGERLVRFKQCLAHTKKTLFIMQRVKTKTLLYLEHDDTYWVYI